MDFAIDTLFFTELLSHWPSQNVMVVFSHNIPSGNKVHLKQGTLEGDEYYTPDPHQATYVNKSVNLAYNIPSADKEYNSLDGKAQSLNTSREYELNCIQIPEPEFDPVDGCLVEWSPGTE